ncbi:ABC transporter substrate-binding protein [Saccharothrix variisporea]|uniref:ABC-type branched-subunit amino acid transport system substrate-binding protein n=1 Tax=Saccharothrix variisporea TaxID=543527 RepID=A0A495X575_9PSEU|nr:ABC transporter substrate-binding protein [Saccharothrix variisporea]RKT69102.1 ABC-type branched-subunit amino acid transport system substrate-binding protein [Saccharothrix variisporea]
MSDLPATASGLTHAALRERETDPGRARELLGLALAEDEEYEPAWRWLAELVDDPAERRFCLDRAAEIVADPATLRARAALRSTPPMPPVEVADLVEPPRPDVPRARRRKRPWAWAAVGLVVALLLAAGGMWSAWGGQAGPPVHVALVTGLTGELAEASAHMENSVRMQVDEVNRAGGIAGRPVELLVYDDEGRPDRAAAIAEEIVREDRAMYVVGHGASNTALAAQQIYKNAGIPAITPSAASPRLTDDSDWYFRSMFGNRTQADFLAVYTSHVLGATSAAVVYDDDEYGQSVHDAYQRSFDGTVTTAVPVAEDAAVDAAARRLVDSAPGSAVLAMTERRGLAMVKRLRDFGFTAPILGTASMGTDALHAALVRDEQGTPGRYTTDLHLGTPLALDSLSGPALVWSQAYEERFGVRPLWTAATARQAFNVGLHAVRGGGLALDRQHRAEDRRKIRDGLAALKDRKNSFPALLGPLYFTAAGSAQMPVSFVTSDGTRLVSAPVQLAIYDPPSPKALQDGLARGEVLRVGERYLTRRQVVATGVNVNEIRDLDTRDGTYFADFFLWLKYTGDHKASDVHFVNAVKADLKPGTPLRDVTENGRTYRLYRVADRFKSGLEFRSFPFDRQQLVFSLQNRVFTADQVVYVTDKEILGQRPEDFLRSGTDSEAGIDDLPNWRATSVRFFQRTVGSSDALGEPTTGGAANGLYYSQYATEIVIARDLLPFLLKNLLPLVLLISVTYLSLFFKAADGAAPVSMGVTAILSTAVLLNNVTSQLPSVSYTVALEWGYYAFILLAATCVLIAMLRKRLVNRGRLETERRLATAARIAYPASILAVVLAYVVAFA